MSQKVALVQEKNKWRVLINKVTHDTTDETNLKPVATEEKQHEEDLEKAEDVEPKSKRRKQSHAASTNLIEMG